MSYSVKWIEENLGISRKALRYYEDKNLMPKNSNRNLINNYREYSEDDINKIWSIKILIGIGYTAKEIYELMNNPKFDFYKSISEKVKELEIKKEEANLYLNFAKTIKLTGRIPTNTKHGCIKFNDFIRYARENWDFLSEGKIIPGIEKTFTKDPGEYTLEDIEKLSNQIELMDYTKLYHSTNIGVYYRIIAELKFLKPEDELVQTVVKLLYKYVSDNNTALGFDCQITLCIFTKYFNPSLFEGDVGLLNEKNFGKDGLLFISRAIDNFNKENTNNKEII